jgi:hypothetical protein
MIQIIDFYCMFVTTFFGIVSVAGDVSIFNGDSQGDAPHAEPGESLLFL